MDEHYDAGGSRPPFTTRHEAGHYRVAFPAAPFPSPASTSTPARTTTRCRFDLDLASLHRIRSGNAALRRETAEEGRHPGGGSAPYGYGIVRRVDVLTMRKPLSQLGQYYVLEDEARWVRRIFAAYLRSGSTVDVARELTGNKVSPPGGGRAWRADTILHILRNTAYVGRVCFGRTSLVAATRTGPDGARCVEAKTKEPLDGHPLATIDCPPIVERGRFEAAQVLVAASQTVVKKLSATANVPLLAGLIWCGDCGAPMAAGSYPRSKLRQGGEYYACKSCKATWNAWNSPRPQWSTYPSRTILPAAGDVLAPHLSEDDRPVVLGLLFDTSWNIPACRRRKLLLLAQMQFVVFNDPFKMEVRFAHAERFPLAAPALLAALAENARVALNDEAYLQTLNFTP